MVNQTVKRNIKRFPQEFCFQLSKEEYEEIILMSQNVTSRFRNEVVHGGRRYIPIVFTEEELAMLSGLLKNDVAIEVSINIMKAFVEMRKFISNNSQVFERLTNVEYKLLEHDKKFDELFDYLTKDKEFIQKIFYNGQIYNAYSLIIDLIKSSKQEIILIDNYIDKTVLDLLSKKIIK